MRALYLLGAGASNAYDSGLRASDRPPVGADLFSCTSARELLELPRYRLLREVWSKCPSRLSSDPEGYLETLAIELDQPMETPSIMPYPNSTDGARDRLVRNALGSFYYFVYELMREFSLGFQPFPNNYTSLFRKIESEGGAVLTLNYDVLLEQSIDRAGGYWHHSPWGGPGLPITKLHGSISWWNPVGAIGWDERRYSDALFERVIQVPYSNRFHTRNLDRLSVSQVCATDLRSMIRSGTDYCHPALLPPIGTHKDYEQVRDYRALWDAARTAVRGAQSLTVIGCGINGRDPALRELLRTGLSPMIPIVVVGRDDRGAHRTLTLLRQVAPQRNPSHSGLTSLSAG